MKCTNKYNLCSLQVDYMEPIVDKITLVEDSRFDSPKSMFIGRVMGNAVYFIWKKNCNIFENICIYLKINVYI